ncbi:hypothetical protein FACS1894101_1830 [Betaproteobacteria bacterium]|nr:hypothetical protein FACS1894101_1830 [Betaproteobacteria bacterium]
MGEGDFFGGIKAQFYIMQCQLRRRFGQTGVEWRLLRRWRGASPFSRQADHQTDMREQREQQGEEKCKGRACLIHAKIRLVVCVMSCAFRARSFYAAFVESDGRGGVDVFAADIASCVHGG